MTRASENLSEVRGPMQMLAVAILVAVFVAGLVVGAVLSRVWP